MKKHLKLALGIVLLGAVVIACGWYLQRYPIPVLQPAGIVGRKERNLIVFCAVLSIAVVVPVLGLLGYFAWKYREGGKKAKYDPNQGGSRLAEVIWWVVPSFLMAIIAVITWQSSYALDPYKPLVSTKQTLHVQVVALDWKWLFIYPGQNVASVNEAAIPTGTPVDFEITSDTVMSSFWDPSLGGQMYAMPGMSAHLNLEADKAGTYPGSSANISGKGFAGMKFAVKAMPDAAFNTWVHSAQQSSQPLDARSYNALAAPSYNNKPAYYGGVQPSLYDTILMKYMMPIQTSSVPDVPAGKTTREAN